MSLSDEQLEKVERHADELRDYIYRQAQVCANCMPWEGGEAVWLATPSPLSDIVHEALDEWGGLKKDGFSHQDIAQVVGALGLQCPGCHTEWDEPWTEVAEEPRAEPVDLAAIASPAPRRAVRRRPTRVPVGSTGKRIIVAFGDMSGFSKWMKSPMVSDSQIEKLMSKVYSEFMAIDRRNASSRYFVKPLGDGVMIVKDLGDRTETQDAEKFMAEVRGLTSRLCAIIAGAAWPQPQGFRVRVVVGDAAKMRFPGPTARSQRLDYIGYPINLAARLLSIKPDARLICHEGAKQLIAGSRRFRSRLVKVRLGPRTSVPKGIDPADLRLLWTVS